MPTETDSAFRERRRFRRFSLALPLQFRLGSGITGIGESINMSSGGLLFRSAATLPAGELIELELYWPVMLDEQRPLRLRLSGMILRGNPDGTAMAISKYEFQTAPPSP